MPVCLECGSQIRYGRTDKKFCCEECKIRHHNSRARAARYFKSKVIAIINRNYEILDALLKDGVDSADLMDLMTMVQQNQVQQYYIRVMAMVCI